MKQNLLNLKSWLLMMCLLVGVGSAWAETKSIEINTTNSGVTGSYADKTFDVNDVTFGFTQWMKSTNIQAKKSTTNSCYNVDAIPGNIKKITVVQTGTARAIKIYGGTSSKPTTEITAPSTAATMEFDFSEKSYTYFSMTTPGNAVYINTITIEYETSGGSSTPTTYNVNIADNITNGTVTASPTSAKEGDDVILTATPATGYEFGSWNVTNASTSAAITVTDNKFTMPAANVNVSATFNKSRPANEIFYESFDTNDGTGGNDNKWSGTIASSTIKFDNDGWDNDKGSGANKCAKFGAGSGQGWAKTPVLGVACDAEMTFKAAAWNGNSESTTLKLSIEGGGTITPSTITLKKGEWTEYTVTLTTLTANSRVKFEGNAASNSRFFLDEISIVKTGEATPEKTATSLSWSAATTSVEYGATSPVFPTLTTDPAGLTGVTYKSSNTAVATINETTGAISIVAHGETTITASYAGNETYKAAQDASYTLTVTKVLDHIGLSGEYKTEFTEDEEFTHDGLVVTAYYNDNSNEDVTLNATFTTPNMTAIGEQTITVTYESKASEYTITVNAVPRYTLTISQPTEGGTLTVKNGDVTLENGATVRVGTNLTCEVTGIPEGKRFSRFYAKWGEGDGESKYKMTNPATFDNIATENISACEIYVTYKDIQYYTINYKVNGVIIASQENVEEKTTLTFPTAPATLGEKTFVGWVAEDFAGTTDEEPPFVDTSNQIADKKKTFYAVYAATEGQEPSAYERVTELSQIAGKKQIVVVHNSDNMVLTHENGNLSGTTQGTAGLTESDNKISIPNDKYIWSIEGDEENGWVLSANGSSLGVSTLPNTNTTGNNANITFTSSNNIWAFGQHNTSNCFYIQNLGETEGTTSIAASYYNGKFNVFTTNGLTSSSSSAFKLYVPDASITYSGYTTTPLGATTITLAATNGTAYYATFVSKNAIVMPEGLTGAAAGDYNDEIAWNWMYEPGSIVPAETPILVKGAESGDYAAPLTIEGGTAPTSNLLYANISDATMAASDIATGASKFYTLSYDNATKSKLGFYWRVDGGASFDVPAGKVFLALPSSMGAKAAYLLSDDSATSINSVESTNTKNNAIYNLNGQRIQSANGFKGIIIVNGKKMLNK